MFYIFTLEQKIKNTKWKKKKIWEKRKKKLAKLLWRSDLEGQNRFIFYLYSRYKISNRNRKKNSFVRRLKKKIRNSRTNTIKWCTKKSSWYFFLEELDVKGRLTKGNLNFFRKPKFLWRSSKTKTKKIFFLLREGKENDGSDFD